MFQSETAVSKQKQKNLCDIPKGNFLTYFLLTYLLHLLAYGPF